MTQGKKYTKQQIISGIKKAWEDGVDLRTSAIQKCEYRYLFRSCSYYFDSWKEALKVAGVSYEVVLARAREYKKQRYLEELREAYREGADLSSSGIRAKESPYKSLYDSIRALYPNDFSWDKVLADARLPVKKIIKREPQRKPYSKLEIILKIIETHNKGVNLNQSSILNSRNKELKRFVKIAPRYFSGGWAEAVNTAGIEYDDYRKRRPNGFWNKTKVIAEIKELQEKGEPLNCGYVRDNYYYLHRAAYNHIGSWNEALRASGIDSLSVRLLQKSFSKKELINKIKGLHEGGYDLSYTAMRRGNMEIRTIYYQSCHRFGSWEEAVIAAALSYEEIRRIRKEYSLEELLEMVQELEHKGMDLKPVFVKKEPEGRRVYEAAMHHVDSWGELLELAGIDRTRYHIPTNWKNGKQILEYLRTNFDAGVVTGASKDRNFAAAVLKYFGTIPAAVEAAGLVYSRGGEITKKMLEDPKVVGILYKHNADFLARIANKVFFGAKRRNLKTLDRSDLINEAFVKFMEILPQKPAKKGVRQFCYWKIYKALIELNRAHFKEITFGREEFLELFRADRKFI